MFEKQCYFRLVLYYTLLGGCLSASMWLMVNYLVRIFVKIYLLFVSAPKYISIKVSFIMCKNKFFQNFENKSINYKSSSYLESNNNINITILQKIILFFSINNMFHSMHTTQTETHFAGGQRSHNQTYLLFVQSTIAIMRQIGGSQR